MRASRLGEGLPTAKSQMTGASRAAEGPEQQMPSRGTRGCDVHGHLERHVGYTALVTPKLRPLPTYKLYLNTHNSLYL